MAICAPDNALGYFKFSLSNAFCITNIDRLLSINMVEMQGRMMRFISTINTTVFHLIIPKPLADTFSSIIGLLINPFPIPRFRKPILSHFLVFYRVILSVPGFAIGCLNFIRIFFTPPFGSFSLSLFLKFCFHDYIIALHNYIVNIYPCKSDIFEATYEKIEEKEW